MKFVRIPYSKLNKIFPDGNVPEDTLIVRTSRGSPFGRGGLPDFRGIIEESLEELKPSLELHRDFQNTKKELGGSGVAHLEAFKKTNYEERFLEDFDGVDIEDIIANEFADYETIVFSCYCAPNSNCHADILVDKFSAAVESDTQLTLFDIEEFESQEEEAPFDADLNKTRRTHANGYWSEKFNAIEFFTEAWWRSGRVSSSTADPEVGLALYSHFKNAPVHFNVDSNKKACRRCGRTFKRKSNRQVYCKTCAPIISNATKRVSESKITERWNTIGTFGFRAQDFKKHMVRFYSKHYVPVTIDYLDDNLVISDSRKRVLSTLNPSSNNFSGFDVNCNDSHRCPECGGKGALYYATRKLEISAKIGSKVIFCSGCGLVLRGAGVR